MISLGVWLTSPKAILLVQGTRCKWIPGVNCIYIHFYKLEEAVVTFDLYFGVLLETEPSAIHITVRWFYVNPSLKNKHNIPEINCILYAYEWFTWSCKLWANHSNQMKPFQPMPPPLKPGILSGRQTYVILGVLDHGC